MQRSFKKNFAIFVVSTDWSAVVNWASLKNHYDDLKMIYEHECRYRCRIICSLQEFDCAIRRHRKVIIIVLAKAETPLSSSSCCDGGFGDCLQHRRRCALINPCAILWNFIVLVGVTRCQTTEKTAMYERYSGNSLAHCVSLLISLLLFYVPPPPTWRVFFF